MDNFRKAAEVKEFIDWISVIALLKALQKMQPNDPYIIWHSPPTSRVGRGGGWGPREASSARRQS